MRQTGGMARGLGLAGRVLWVVAFLGLVVGALAVGPGDRAGAATSQATVGQSPQTTVPGAPSASVSTIAPLSNDLPRSPATLPLRTRSTNAHVSAAFAYLSVAGFVVAILIVLGRIFLTRPGGPDRQPVPLEGDLPE